MGEDLSPSIQEVFSQVKLRAMIPTPRLNTTAPKQRLPSARSTACTSVRRRKRRKLDLWSQGPGSASRIRPDQVVLDTVCTLAHGIAIG